MPYPTEHHYTRSNRYLENTPGARPHRRGYPTEPAKGSSHGGPIVLLVQATLCLLILAAIFTMQFFEPAQYEKAGEYYHQIMSGEQPEDKTLQTLATPVNIDTLRDFWNSLNAGEILEVFNPTKTAAMGGEESTFPRNASYAKVVVSAPARSPLPCDAEITSGYGIRTHPITGKWDFHTGIDLAAAAGTEIRAIYPGTVVATGSSDTYGKYIVLEHDSHLRSMYCHCSKIVAKKGDHVSAGENIALVGSTGISTGSHLHLSILYDGYYVDPMNLYPL